MSEGLNSKIQKIKSMACGFRNIENFKTAIYIPLRRARSFFILNTEGPKIIPEVEELYGYYQASDIVVFILRSECYPSSVLEVRPSDFRSLQFCGLAEAMHMFLCNPVGAAAMVARAHAKVWRLFDSDKFLERHLDLAKQIAVEDCPSVSAINDSIMRVSG